jgi:hypothetical protein
VSDEIGRKYQKGKGKGAKGARSFRTMFPRRGGRGSDGGECLGGELGHSGWMDCDADGLLEPAKGGPAILLRETWYM